MSSLPYSDNRTAVSTLSRAATALLVVVVAACSSGGGSGNNAGPTAPTPPPPPPPPSSSAQIAVIGCSQTSNAWRGWIAGGDMRVWELFQGYGGGDVSDWARDVPNGDYWNRFDVNVDSNPDAGIIWWQLCTLLSRPGTEADVDAIAAEIKRRIPGVVIYVTPLAEFEKPETCNKDNLPNSRALTDYLVGNGTARRGPELPRVLDAWIQPPQGDGGCHVGADGRAEFGAALTNFNWPAP